ncbi:kinase-like domain-containing protein [Rhizophagus clarus]|uniref:Kinase-like domain-containing protein n=1 Tax=Rhizophagus clarus TaxID=94130 RepID=A0A8H3QVU8_9GLOM|nr:kinase-like domain-containing protein [Rhizophagus clarus]
MNSNINIDNSIYTGLTQINKNFFKVNILEIEPTTQDIKENIFEEDLSILIDKLAELYFEETNKGKEGRVRKQFVLKYFNNHNINLQEIYEWLLNNMTYSNSIFLLGYFNYHGIGIEINMQNAFKLYQKAAELGNFAVQYDLANMYIDGEGTDKDYGKAFEISNKLVEEKYACGINLLGFCYEYNIGTNINEQKAFELYQKAADLGNIFGMFNLGCCYKNGFGTDVNKKKAFELFKMAAGLGNLHAIHSLASCYKNGLGTDVNKNKAFELFQKAANFGYNIAQQNLARMYEKGYGTNKNIDKAIYWYKKSAKQGNKYSQNKLLQLLVV